MFYYYYYYYYYYYLRTTFINLYKRDFAKTIHRVVVLKSKARKGYLPKPLLIFHANVTLPPGSSQSATFL
jgi:hypothetical protein